MTKSVGKIYIITIETGIVNVISSKVINTEGFLDEGQEEKDFTDTKNILKNIYSFRSTIYSRFCILKLYIIYLIRIIYVIYLNSSIT